MGMLMLMTTISGDVARLCQSCSCCQQEITSSPRASQECPQLQGLFLSNTRLSWFFHGKK